MSCLLIGLLTCLTITTNLFCHHNETGCNLICTKHKWTKLKLPSCVRPLVHSKIAPCAAFLHSNHSKIICAYQIAWSSKHDMNRHLNTGRWASFITGIWSTRHHIPVSCGLLQLTTANFWTFYFPGSWSIIFTSHLLSDQFHETDKICKHRPQKNFRSISHTMT